MCCSCACCFISNTLVCLSHAVLFQIHLYVCHMRLQGTHTFLILLLQGIIEIVEKFASSARAAATVKVSVCELKAGEKDSDSGLV